MRKNVMRNISAGMIILILMLSCFYAGTGVEQKFGKVSNQTTEKIAVVNMDEGVAKTGEEAGRIYYSNELLGYNDTDMEMVSLESARNGIVEGRYGAYLILPADFSENIESINTDPMKAEVTYAINPYLNSDATKIDIVVLDHDTQEEYYIPAVVADVKAHTYPDGTFQTNLTFPNGEEGSGNNADKSTVEFMGYNIPDKTVNITNNYQIRAIMVYEGQVNY